MKNLDTDILKETLELKEMPFSVPENYFDGLKASLKMIPQQTESVASARLRLGRLIAMAASFALLIAAGSFFLGRNSHEDFLSEEDYLVYADDMTIAIEEESDQFAEAWSMTDEDIIEYLLATGIEVEEVESY